MTVRIRVPGDIDVATRFFGRFTWKDLLRVLVPTLGLGMIHPAGAVVGLLVGAGLYIVRPHGAPIDSHAYHALRYRVQRATGGDTLPDIERVGRGHITTETGAAVAGVTVSPTNLDLKTDTEQRAVLDTYRNLLEQVRFPVHVVSRQTRIQNGEKTTHAVIVRVDGSHDNPEAEAERRIDTVRDALTEGDLSADRLSAKSLRQLSRIYTGETDHRCIDTGNGHVRVAAITEHPSEVDLGWVRRLLRVDGRVDIHQVIQPRDPRTTEKQLEREKETLTAEISSLVAGGFLGTNRLEARLSDTEWMLDLLARRQDIPVNYAAYIVVRGDTQGECDELYDRVTSVLRAEVREPVFRMDHAQRTLSPLTGDSLNETLLMPARSAASGFPFCTQDTNEDGGVQYGTDSHDGTPVVLNRWDWKAPHMARMGATGSGKSYATKLELLRQADQVDDLQIYVVDPKQEYGGVVAALDGITYQLDAPISAADDLPLWNETRAACLQVADRGAATNTAHLVDAVRHLYTVTARDSRPTLVVIDEAHNLLEDAEGREVVTRFVREARDTNTAVTLVTQNAADFTDVAVGRKLLKNVQATIFHQHEQVEDSTRRLFGLSDFETQELHRLKTGTEAGYSEAVVRVGKRLQAKLKIQSSRDEAAVIEEGVGAELETVEAVSGCVPESDEEPPEQDSERSDTAEYGPIGDSDIEEHHAELRRLEEQIEARQQELIELNEELRHRRNTDHDTVQMEQMLPELPAPGWAQKPVRPHGQLPHATQQISATYTAPDGRFTVTIARYSPDDHDRIVQTEALDKDQFPLWAPINDTIIAVTIHAGRIPDAARLIGQSPVIDGDTEVKVVDEHDS